MNSVIKKNLENREGNYVLPFFWQHGESEEVLRKYMGAINDCGIMSVCVESRPHPDFVGPRWWKDLDIILDEARKRRMKVWILDDSHFPTGYANGAVEGVPQELCRQSIVCQSLAVHGKEKIRINIEDYMWPEFKKSVIENYILNDPSMLRTFDDNRLLSLTAWPEGGGEPVSLEGDIRENMLLWDVPPGKWKICFCVLTRNMGPHRNYINMLDARSCRMLIDTVYEPHFARYRDDFGKTIAGFFSDEPELGNGHLYEQGNIMGCSQDLPWSTEMERELEGRLGKDYARLMPLLWDDAADGEAEARAKVRYAYMDSLTRLVEKDFSKQLGEWCRDHGVEYIGHLIEDNNQHARTGSSLGHFFRGLSGQDMSGIDDIGGQVLPQGEDLKVVGPMGGERDGEFYHYALGKLGASQGAVDPIKKGRTMCEIFGAYGWGEGVRLEKYLADHFMVRGINRFVPHAFSGKEYPDPDCPPHFYAHGNNPQYRHFGSLVRYMNRVSGLIDGGRHIAPAAILYHGEAEWTGKYMLMQKPAHLLADRQIDYDFIPADVFAERARYKTVTDGMLSVNTQDYKVLIVPEAQFISAEFARAAGELHRRGFPVVFINSLPEGVYNGDNALIQEIKGCPVISLDELVPFLDERKIPEISIYPADDRVRCLHYCKEKDLYYFINEGIKEYTGTVKVPTSGNCYVYNAWDNRLEKAEAGPADEETGAEAITEVKIVLEAMKSLIIVFDEGEVPGKLCDPVRPEGKEYLLREGWKRSICRSIDYPTFKEEKDVRLPDSLAEEMPEFSGFVRYENTFNGKAGQKTVLEITDAAEGVEVFVNNISAGIQIVPVFRYDITELVKDGVNSLTIEVATTLEREVFKMHGPGRFGPGEPSALSGITGDVRMYCCLAD